MNTKNKKSILYKEEDTKMINIPQITNPLKDRYQFFTQMSDRKSTPLLRIDKIKAMMLKNVI